MTEIRDHSGLSGVPDAILRPQTALELAEYLRSHPEGKLRIGAGLTGVSGGAIPLEDETYIDCKGLRAMSWYDPQSGVLYAEAGVPMAELKHFVEAAGWFFPVMPGSLERATLGGMLACNGGGPYSLRYGKMGHFTLGLEIVTISGEIQFVGSKCKKVSEGPAWQQLLVGSEGTLAVITGAYLQCIAPMRDIVLTRIAHTSFWKLLDVIPKLLQQNPLLLEMAEKEALAFSSGVDEAVIWFGSESAPQLDLSSDFRVKQGGMEGLAERFTIGHRLQTYKPFVDLDVAFPPQYSTLLLSKFKELFQAKGLEHIFFGHAGDGNWHIHVFYDVITETLTDAISEMDLLLQQYDGHISGEHGIGRVHRGRMQHKVSDIHRQLYLALKQSLDPQGRLDSLL